MMKRRVMRSPVVIALVVGFGACLSGSGACAARVLTAARRTGRMRRELRTRRPGVWSVHGYATDRDNDARGASARQVKGGANRRARSGRLAFRHRHHRLDTSRGTHVAPQFIYVMKDLRKVVPPSR